MAIHSSTTHAHIDTSGSLKRKVKISGADTTGACINVAMTAFLHALYLQATHDQSKLKKALMALNIIDGTLDIPCIVLNEMDADAYYTLKILSGLTNLGFAGAQCAHNQDPHNLFVAALLAATGIRKTSDAIKYFQNGTIATDNLPIHMKY